MSEPVDTQPYLTVLHSTVASTASTARSGHDDFVPGPFVPRPPRTEGPFVPGPFRTTTITYQVHFALRPFRTTTASDQDHFAPGPTEYVGLGWGCGVCVGCRVSVGA